MWREMAQEGVILSFSVKDGAKTARLSRFYASSMIPWIWRGIFHTIETRNGMPQTLAKNAGDWHIRG